MRTVKSTLAEREFSFHLRTARFCSKNETPHDKIFLSRGKKEKPPVETGGLGWQYIIQENDGWHFLSKHREMTAHSTEAWEFPKPST